MTEPGYKPGLTLATQIQTQGKTRVNFLNANVNANAKQVLTREMENFYFLAFTFSIRPPRKDKTVFLLWPCILILKVA